MPFKHFSTTKKNSANSAKFILPPFQKGIRATKRLKKLNVINIKKKSSLICFLNISL